MAPFVEFLGHLVDEKGVCPLPEKIQAIQQATVPTNLTELKSYIGLLSYYGKFLPWVATDLVPLYQLLNKDAGWEWTAAQEQTFQKSKELLTSDSLLTHYNPQLPLVLACDVSAYGIGAVLAHIFPNSSEKPIAYASRTLQIEREVLSCMFGVKRFYPYLLGQRFTLITNHKPLLSLLNSQKPTSPQASARIHRWSLYLSMFEYEFKFRNTTSHANADALSRLPLADTVASSDLPPELVLLTTNLDSSPITADQIKDATRRDPELSLVSQFLQQGWPSQCPTNPALKPYFIRKTELSSLEGYLLW